MSDIPKGPTYRIETPRLVLRCYNPTDAPLLEKTVQKSKDFLLPWMPWVNSEPEKLQVKIDRLRRFRANFDSDKEYVFGIFNDTETELIGGTGFHPQIGDDALEIGYFIHVDHIRKGYCTEAVKALLKIAFTLKKINRIEIHCDPVNIASASIPKILGFTHDGTLRARTKNYKGEPKSSMIWSLFKQKYEQTQDLDIEISAFNAGGIQLL